MLNLQIMTNFHHFSRIIKLLRSTVYWKRKSCLDEHWEEIQQNNDQEGKGRSLAGSKFHKTYNTLHVDFQQHSECKVDSEYRSMYNHEL